MLDFNAISHVSYGLYVICAGDKQQGNGYISNTFFQVTSNPVQLATCCNKDNYTAGLISKTQRYSVSILHKETDNKIFGQFGYRSGKDGNKFEGMEISYSEEETPIFTGDCIAWIECKVVQTIDVGSHWMFIGEMVASEVKNATIDPLTYLDYKRIKKGVAPKNAPTYIDPSILEPKKKQDRSQYKCLACGYIYDDAKEEVTFENLPEDWKCPICGAEKDDFEKM